MTKDVRSKGTDTLRAISVWKHDYYNKTYDFAAKELADHARWLTASLLAINGAAGVALIDTISTNSSHKCSAILFFAGVLFSILSGYCLQNYYMNAGQPCHDLAEYWLRVSETEIEDADELQKHRTTLKQSERGVWLPPALGWLSGLSFIAGAITLVV